MQPARSLHGGCFDSPGLSLRGEKFAEWERRGLDRVALFERHRGGEQRAVVDERMVLAALAAWIDAGREIESEADVDLAAAPRRVKALAVRADDNRTPAAGDELAQQLSRVALPERVEAAKAGPREQTLAIIAQVFEVDVTKCNGLDAMVARALEGREHGLLARVVARQIDRACLRVGRREVPIGRHLDGEERHAEALSLLMHELDAYAVHADPLMLRAQRRHQSGDLVLL